MIFGSKRGESSHRTAVIRDIVEVIAIIGAGAWAIYTFVFLESLKPSAEAPELTISGSLHRLGERHGIVQFSYGGVIQNTGHTRAYVLADGFTVTGVRVAPQLTPSATTPYNGAVLYERDARIQPRGVIYKFYQLTRYASPAFGDGFAIDPGQNIPFSGIFAVKTGPYDSIALYGSLAYAKYLRTYPTRVRQTPNGVVLFDSENGDRDFNPLEVTLDRASLW